MSKSKQVTLTERDRFSQITVGSLFWLWLPLALSFTLMMVEGPVVHGALARLTQAQLHLAAFGLTLSVSLIIESPVIMLLATAIALVEDADSYRAVRRFMVLLSAGLTILTALTGFTSLFNWITEGLMGVPTPIVRAARPAMQIMLFWTAAIAWRRFYQGILVRHGQTRLVSWGAAIRLISVLLVASWLVSWGGLPGAQVGAIAVMAGVVVEAVVVTGFALPIVRRVVLPLRVSKPPPLTQRAILKFHAPLAGTTLLTLLVQPVTAAALARLAEPPRTLAAWPVVVTTLLVLRGLGFTLQEITIASTRAPGAFLPLRSFTWMISGVTSSLLGLLTFTPLLDFYLGVVLHLQADLHSYVYLGLVASIPLPALTALISWARGLLVAAGATHVVYRGMGINLLTNCILLGIGVLLQLPGMIAASGALVGANLIEYRYLIHRV